MRLWTGCKVQSTPHLTMQPHGGVCASLYVSRLGKSCRSEMEILVIGDALDSQFLIYLQRSIHDGGIRTLPGMNKDSTKICTSSHWRSATGLLTIARYTTVSPASSTSGPRPMRPLTVLNSFRLFQYFCGGS
jgi:hypothetical protein